ncbi:MAG: CvpA family protein [Clostridia bacterium]|nr:CvpA family protein [Clostridia bacterium]
MNIVDYVILGIIGLSVLWGFYRGFIQSVLNMGGCLVALVGSFYAYPHLAQMIQSNQDLVRNLIHYTDASSRLGDLELSLTNVSALGQETLNTILSNVALPEPLSSLLSYNLENKVFAAQNITTVSDYVNQTIVSVSINIICFLLCFVAIYLVISVVCNLLRAVFRFPLLKQLDWLVGGVFGALRGVIFCYAIFVLIPLVQTIIPFEEFGVLLEASALAPIFNNGNLILSIMNRAL